MIKVFDDFFEENIRSEIYNLLLRPKWSFSAGREGRRFWHMGDLHNEDYFSNYVFNLICQKLNKDFKINRIYANGQTAGQCGNPHYDDGDATLLYYPNPNWNLEDQGHLVFLENDNEVSRIVTYKSNRAVFFDSKVKHYADAPHRLYSDLRISLAYKLLIKNP